MGTLDIDKVAHYALMEDAPKVQVSLGFNKAYFLFNFNNTEIYKIHIIIHEYSGADKLPHEFVDTYEVEVYPFETNYANNEQDTPLHHVYKDINCSWYTAKISYVYSYPSAENESRLSYSKTTTLEIDNHTPVIYSGFISKFIKGDLQHDLNRSRSIVLWYGEEGINPRVKDTIFMDPAMLSIVNISNSGIITTKQTSLYYKEFFLSILTNTKFNDILEDYFKELSELPEYGELPFTFNINQKDYEIIIKGNIKELYEKGL